ncbi:hypothetical protein P8C59_005317 [Phyllachora maydis]|uniref:Uncharacterized protein n=1 Tax=Phyllachora maydis TaxID=1825666 RepID=A0AAD9I469_9PEZI|nr:hypothetical protein P8C59_005317 [Phyllachora maydis]
MDSVVKYVLNKSKLEVTLIRITDATPDSFIMSIESRVTDTGPISSTMLPMVVDMTFNGGCFGKLQLPEVKTASGGVPVNIYDQHIKILDMACFKAFVKSLMHDEHLILKLDNGQCTIKTLGMSSNVIYRKEIHLKGMRGPPVEIRKATETFNTMAVRNLSPLEIDHGVSSFHIQDGAGNTVAELRGPLEIKRGEFEVTMTIKRTGRKPCGNEGTLVGAGTDNDAWTSETLVYINTPVKLTEEFVACC